MWKAYAESSAGAVRSDNQDYWLATELKGHRAESMLLCCVADGLGGHQAGNVASKLAVLTLLDAVIAGLPEGVPGKALCDAFPIANSVVFRESGLSDALHGMGTTLTAALLTDSSCSIAHIGDSRAYLLSGGALAGLTEDHSLVQDLLRQGRITRAEAEVHPQRHVLTRALGIVGSVLCDSSEHILESDDVLLLCTDGLTRVLSDAEIADILASNVTGAAKASALVALAMERGAPDNVTVVVAVREGSAR